MRSARNPGSTARGTLAAAGLGVIAVLCCAGLPLAVGLVGALTLGAAFGLGAGILGVAALVVLAVWARRRRRCTVTDPSNRP